MYFIVHSLYVCSSQNDGISNTKAKSVSVFDSLSRGLVPLHNACSYGHYEVAEQLVQHMKTVNVVDLWKFTPLHEAAAKAKYEICRLLLKVSPSHTSCRYTCIYEDILTEILSLFLILFLFSFSLCVFLSRLYFFNIVFFNHGITCMCTLHVMFFSSRCSMVLTLTVETGTT